MSLAGRGDPGSHAGVASVKVPGCWMEPGMVGS